jgi:hypothetical protein
MGLGETRSSDPDDLNFRLEVLNSESVQVLGVWCVGDGLTLLPVCFLTA